MSKDLIVKKIENGTVIDHIKPGHGLEVLRILGVKRGHSNKVAAVMNVESKQYARKDIVKIEDRELSEDEISRIALVAPSATLNIIRNGEVVEKRKIALPLTLRGIIKCPNPKCVTNASSEQIASKFAAEFGNFRCFYCERLFRSEELIW